MMQLPVPVHIGSQSPEHWDDVEARQQRLGDEAAPYLRDMQRPSVAISDLNWEKFGFAPRWVGFDTVDCAAALQPSVYSSEGADEFSRFRMGAEGRGETALVISLIGSTAAKQRNLFSIFGSAGDSVSIGQSSTSVAGQSIGKGAQVRASDDIGDADGQLALRLLSCPSPPTWRALTLVGEVTHSVYGQEYHPPEGTLVPILETELGEPVVAVWLSPDGVERRYIVPVETPWKLLLSWLLEQALPEFVPKAMRRARHPLASDKDLMTRQERDAQDSLAELDAEYAARRENLHRQFKNAQDAASLTREGLLYGTGQQLVDAVRRVFETADIDAIDLDERFGDTKNADLLCTFEGKARLVEVKSASGNASEHAYQDLTRHLREWPNLPGATPIIGGALVMSQNLRQAPHERTLTPYTRPEFLSAQTEPVITALRLFELWRDEDKEAIRQLLFASDTTPALNAVRQDDAVPPTTATPGSARRRWFRRD